jgi:hypothetical protein
MKEFGQMTVINGIIMPHNWDESGKAIEIALYTDKEEVYAVKHNRLAQQLMTLIYKRVEVKGKIRVDQNGGKSIAVQHYMVPEEMKIAESE